MTKIFIFIFILIACQKNEKQIRPKLAEKYAINPDVYEFPNKMQEMLKNSKYDELDEFITSVIFDKNYHQNGNSQLFLVLEKFNKIKDLDQLSLAWMTKKPSSPFAKSYYAKGRINKLLLKKNLDITRLKEDKVFINSLNEIKQDLIEAKKLHPTIVLNDIFLLEVSRFLKTPSDEIAIYYNKGISLLPDSLRIRFKYLLTADPKWFGSNEEFISRARDLYRNARVGSRARLILWYGHMLMAKFIKDKKTYYNKEKVWPEMKNSLAEVIEIFPNDMMLKCNMLLGAYFVNDIVLFNEYSSQLKLPTDIDLCTNENEKNEILKLINLNHF